MRILLVLVALSTSAFAATPASECRDIKAGVKVLLNGEKDYELRSMVGGCLLRQQIDKPEVARAGLQILRDSTEDILLKEDLMAAFADGQIRRKIRVEGKLAPEMNQQDKDAVDRALSGAGSIIAAARAVKTIEEVVPVTHLEADYFRTLSDIALDESGTVLLRASAVAALEKLSIRVVDSGIYDEKSVRLVKETLRTVAARDDESSYFTNAGVAYENLAQAGIPGFGREMTTGRMLSSTKPPTEK